MASVVVHVVYEFPIEIHVSVVVPDDIIRRSQAVLGLHDVNHVAERSAIVTKHFCGVLWISRAGRQFLDVSACCSGYVLERISVA
jgi:hypothetical protein